MRRTSSSEVKESSSYRGLEDIKPRLNLNDLLERKKIEKKLDKRTNVLIISGMAVVACVVLAILNF